jgi:hypothetical protein
MAIDLEVKHRLRELEARIQALEDRVPSADPVVSHEVVRQMVDSMLLASSPSMTLASKPAETKKMCPKCGVKPAYFFHVRACKG